MFRIAIAAAVCALFLPAQALAGQVVISQVYGGGGNKDATLTNDFVELHNNGQTPIDITGWTVQYASSAGSTWQKTSLAGTIPAGAYYLVQEAKGAGGTFALPQPEATGAIPMSATAGKVALASDGTLLTGTCPSGVVDLVGFGSASCSETAPTPTLSNITAALRNGGGCVDTGSNLSDFTVGDPAPRNGASRLHVCGDEPPTVVSTFPEAGDAIAPDEGITVTFSEPVSVAAGGFTVSCGGGTWPAAVTGGPTEFTIDPDGDLPFGAGCELTIHAASVTDTDGAPDAMGADVGVAFEIITPCGASYQRIPAIQGSGDTVTTTGSVVTEGVVVGDYEGPAPNLRGFFVQDPTGDGEPATSDAIFVFEGDNADKVSLGDAVRVAGKAGEYQGQSQITSTAVLTCGTGTVAPTDVMLPFASTGFPERYEGMLVRMPQRLSVTEHYQLGRYGEVLLSSGGRLYQPTSLVEPGAPAAAMQAQNDLNQILLDDGSNDQNPDPILFGRGGLPLSAVNTLRGGDTAARIVGVLSYGFGAYMLEPFHALGGSAIFVAANPRPATPPEVGGALKVVGMNLLNFFNTFSGCTNGVGGAATDCRGANNAAEFARQWPKTVAAIVDMNADVVGIVEIENDGYGADSAIAFLVDRLNEATAPGTWAYVDVDTATGQVDALGTDAIKVGVLYKPARVTPGGTAALNSKAFVNGGDLDPRNRPALAQAFVENATGEKFVLSVNHLKSKGSACDAPDSGDGQGNCAGVRTNAANLLASWLAADPTGSGAANRNVIVGDLNSYAKEDPIAALEGNGFTNLVAAKLGAQAYSYVFDGQWGYLDHALGSAGILSDVTGVGEWHINADEPSVLDYNVEYKSAAQIASLYAPDRYRISDHDPVLVGLTLHTTVARVLSLVQQFVTKNEGLRNSLSVKLRNGAYGAFANEARAQSGKALTAEQSTLLQTLATRL